MTFASVVGALEALKSETHDIAVSKSSQLAPRDSLQHLNLPCRVAQPTSGSQSRELTARAVGKSNMHQLHL